MSNGVTHFSGRRAFMELGGRFSRCCRAETRWYQQAVLLCLQKVGPEFVRKDFLSYVNLTDS